MSDANRIRMSYIEEVTFGTTPAGALQELRLTGETFTQNTTTVTSGEIRSDRQVSAVKRTDISAVGSINIELSYNAYDDLLEAGLLSSDWAALITDTQITFSMTNSDNSINDSGSGFVTKSYDQYSWVLISGFTTAANNGFFKLGTVTAGKMILSGGTVTDEVAGDSVTILQGAEITNGTEARFFSIEREYQDLATTFAAFRGVMWDQFSLAVNAGQLITGSLSAIGKAETSETATIGTSYTAATTKDIMSAVDDVFAILENATSFDATSFTLQLSNNLAARSIIGTLGAVSIRTGSIEVTGTLQAYFDATNKAQYAKYLDQTETSLTLQLKDQDDNYYLIDLPRVRLTTGGRPAGSLNSDCMLDLNYSAYMHASELKTIRIQKYDA